MGTGIILVSILIIIAIVGGSTKRKVTRPELKEQFTIAEEDKRDYIQDLFSTIRIPKHKYPLLINKLNSLRCVIGITEEKIKEQLKPILLDLLIPNYYAIRYTNPNQSYKQQSVEKNNYTYIFREDNILNSRA